MPLWMEMKKQGSGNKLTKDLNMLKYALAFSWILYDNVTLSLCLRTFLYLKLLSFRVFNYVSVVN